MVPIMTIQYLLAGVVVRDDVICASNDQHRTPFTFRESSLRAAKAHLYQTSTSLGLWIRQTRGLAATRAEKWAPISAGRLSIRHVTALRRGTPNLRYVAPRTSLASITARASRPRSAPGAGNFQWTLPVRAEFSRATLAALK